MDRLATVTKRFEFEAAHQLPNHRGKCKNVHGHNYVVEVAITGPVNAIRGETEEGMVIDFYDIKSLVGPTIEAMDHAFIACGDEPVVGFWRQGFEEAGVAAQKIYRLYKRSTAENIANHLLNVIDHGLSGAIGNQCKVEYVRVWETPDSSAIARPTVIKKTSILTEIADALYIHATALVDNSKDAAILNDTPDAEITYAEALAGMKDTGVTDRDELVEMIADFLHPLKVTEAQVTVVLNTMS